MKITTKKYAEALLEALDGKSEKEAKQIISRLLKIFVSKNKAKDINFVLEDFEKLWNNKYSLRSVEVTTASEITPNSKKIIKKYIIKKLGVERVELEEKIDKDILGGVIIRERDKVFDGSLRTRLYDLKEKIAK